MTKNEIMRMARESGMPDPMVFIGAYERFSALLGARAAAAERESCAIAAWSAGMDAHNAAGGLPCDARDVGSKAASAIRARGNQ